MITENDFVQVTNFNTWLKAKYFPYERYCEFSFDTLSERELEVLLRMYLIKQSNVSVICKGMCLPEGSVSNIMSRLFKKKYVYKIYPKTNEDARKRHYYISETGIETVKNIIEDYIKLSKILYDKMDSTHKNEFIRVSEIMSEMFSGIGEYRLSESISLITENK